MSKEPADHLIEGISMRIRMERKLKDLTQENVVEILDDELSVSTLSRYENCSETMTVKKLAKISQALEINVSDLLSDEDSSTESRITAKFIFYFPLIPWYEIADVIWRIGGLFYGREGYVNHLLDFLIKEIPDSPAKKWADFNVKYRPIAAKFQKIWGLEEGLEFLRKYPEVMALFGEDNPDDCFYDYFNMVRKQNPLNKI